MSHALIGEDAANGCLDARNVPLSTSSTLSSRRYPFLSVIALFPAASLESRLEEGTRLRCAATSAAKGSHDR